MTDVGTVRIDLTTGTLCLKIDGLNSNQTSVKPVTINPGNTGTVTFDVENSCADDAALNLNTSNLPDGINLTFTKDSTPITFPYIVSGNSTDTITVHVDVGIDLPVGAKYYIYLYFSTNS